MEEGADIAQKQQSIKEFVEKVQTFYKIHSNLPIIRQKRFDDFEQEFIFKEIHFIKSKIIKKFESSLLTAEPNLTPPKNLINKILQESINIDKDFLYCILGYLHVENEKISKNEKIELCKHLLDDKFIKKLLSRYKSYKKKCAENPNEENSHLLNIYNLLFLYIYILNINNYELFLNFKRVSEILIKNLQDILVMNIERHNIYLDFRLVLKLLRFSVMSFLGSIKDTYDNKLHAHEKYSKRIKGNDLSIINYFDCKKHAQKTNLLLQYRRKCTAALKIPIYSPINVTHEHLSNLLKESCDKQELDSILNIIKERNPIYDEIDELNSYLLTPFTSSLLFVPENSITYFFNNYVFEKDNILIIFSEFLKRFENEHINEDLTKGLNCMGLMEYKYIKDIEKYLKPDRMNIKSFNISKDITDSLVETEENIRLLVEEIKRYRDSIASDISYLILLLSKHLKNNKAYQFLFYLKRIEKSRILEVLLQYIADFGRIENCSDYMKLVELSKKEISSVTKLQKKPSFSDENHSFTNHIEINKLELIKTDNIENSNENFIVRTNQRLGLISNVLHVSCTMCKHSYLFCRYIKSKYRTIFYDILNDIKSQKILYYVPKIYTYFASVISKGSNMEFDRVYARDYENYCVGIDYHQQNIKKEEIFALITKYPNPWKQVLQKGSIVNILKYDINNPEMKKNLQLWESLFKHSENVYDPLHPMYFDEFNFSRVLQQNCKTLRFA